MVPRRFEDLFPLVACMTLLVFAPVCLAQAPSARTLAPILVEDDPQVLTPLPSASHLVLESVPGSVSSMPSQQYRTGAVISLSDALSRIPGMYAQSSSGQVSAKISIRGSGLAAASGLRGIRLLRDGLPLGRADDLGDSIYLDPMGASQIEIYRGASSLQFGAATLGGAINLISPTGYSNPGLELRVEGGPDQYRQTQVRAGAVRDPDLDTFASFTRYRSDGFRQHAKRESNRFYGNIGWRFNPLSAGRLHLTLETYHIQMPGPLSLEQLQKDPRPANPTNLSARTQIHTSPRWHLAYQHEWHTGQADKLSLGFFHTGTKFDSSSTVFIRYDAVDYGMALRHEINREWKGRAYQLVWGASYSGGQSNNRVNTPAYLPGPATQLGAVDARRSTLEVFAENHLPLHPALTLVAGAQASWAKRQTHNSMSALMGALGYPNGNASAHYLGIHPKLGVIWAVSRNAQLFANLSRNTEAPHSLIFYTPSGKLKAQRAHTVEIGTRGGGAEFAWEAALYQSTLRNELLETLVANSPTLPPLAHNANATRHRGLELGLHGQWRLGPLPGNIAWNVAYTWSHLRFRHDAHNGNNALPSVPPHLARLDVSYRHPSGFYAGPTVELASGWKVDQANTLTAPGYGTLNVTLGYQPPHGRYRVFIDARNLANKYYAATTNYLVDARLQSKDVFHPGQTRAVFVGAQINW